MEGVARRDHSLYPGAMAQVPPEESSHLQDHPFTSSSAPPHLRTVIRPGWELTEWSPSCRKTAVCAMHKKTAVCAMHKRLLQSLRQKHEKQKGPGGVLWLDRLSYDSVIENSVRVESVSILHAGH